MGGTASEARRGDGAKRKSVRKSCRSAGDPAWKTMGQHREAAASSQIRPRCARLLAKPEYFSPPDEVCCWPGRRSGAADLPGRQCRLAGTWRRAIEKMLPARDAVVEIHREAAADRNAVAQRAARNPGQMITT